jgi:hypothetical protein
MQMPVMMAEMRNSRLGKEWRVSDWGETTMRTLRLVQFYGSKSSCDILK